MAAPVGAIQCNGPLMYDPSRYITSDGTIYKNYKSSGFKMMSSDKASFNWSSAKKLIGGTEVPMESIEGFYNLKSGTIPRHALVAYYFVEKADPTEMVAEFIVDNGEINPENLHWVSNEESKPIIVANTPCAALTVKNVNCKKSGTKFHEENYYCAIHFKMQAPSETTSCSSMTQKGTQCKLSATKDFEERRYCTLHYNKLTKKQQVPIHCAGKTHNGIGCKNTPKFVNGSDVYCAMHNNPISAEEYEAL